MRTKMHRAKLRRLGLAIGVAALLLMAFVAPSASAGFAQPLLLMTAGWFVLSHRKVQSLLRGRQRVTAPRRMVQTAVAQ